MRKRWRTRAFGLRALIPLAIVSVLLLAPSSALADALPYETWFQGQNGDLWAAYTDGQYYDMGLGMAPGTSPSIATFPGGRWEVAFQANTGHLITYGTEQIKDWDFGMAPGTSPSITALPDGGFEVAAQADTGELWTIGDAGVKEWGRWLAPGTSPSIAASSVSDFGFEVAFQGTNGDLQIAHSAGGFAEDLGWIFPLDEWTGCPDSPWGCPGQQVQLAPGTSPSITVSGGSYEVALQDSNGDLWTTNDAGFGTDMNLGVASGTSPSIASLTGGRWMVAFQANSGDLWTVESSGESVDTGGGMAPGTSPSITGLPDGDRELAWNAYYVDGAPDGRALFNLGSASGWVNTMVGMAPGTSPAIASSP